MKKVFGSFIREKREKLRKTDSAYSLRKVAGRIGVEPSYLSKVERGDQAPPSEEKIKALASELDENPDVLLAMAGKVSTDLQEIIRKRPELFSQLIIELKDLPDHALLRIAREARGKGNADPKAKAIIPEQYKSSRIDENGWIDAESDAQVYRRENYIASLTVKEKEAARRLYDGETQVSVQRITGLSQYKVGKINKALQETIYPNRLTPKARKTKSSAT